MQLQINSGYVTLQLKVYLQQCWTRTYLKYLLSLDDIISHIIISHIFTPAVIHSTAEVVHILFAGHIRVTHSAIELLYMFVLYAHLV